MFSLSLRCLALLDASFRDIRVGEYGQSLLFLSSSPTHFRLCPLFSPTPQCIYFADRNKPVERAFQLTRNPHHISASTCEPVTTLPIDDLSSYRPISNL